jgi:uncharacterized protein
VALAVLPRLVEAVEACPGSADVEMHFFRDEQGLYILEGRLSAEVVTLCQRCLEPVDVALKSEFKLGIVRDDEGAKQLPGYLEPLINGGEPFDLHVVVEDELLLSLPFSPYHDATECLGGEYQQPTQDVIETGTERPNPFQVLASLKTKQ